MIGSIQELIAQERTGGASDDQIATPLRSSRIPPPEGHHHWQRVAVRAAMGEDSSGLPR